MIKRPFRFAITGRGSTGPEFLDFARRAEDLGFDTLAFPDHLPPPNVQLSPLLSIAAAAQVTKTIKFTTTTLFNDFRHPAVLAKEVAALDMLTEGRYELGIGTGSSPPTTTCRASRSSRRWLFTSTTYTSSRSRLA